MSLVLVDYLQHIKNGLCMRSSPRHEVIKTLLQALGLTQPSSFVTALQQPQGNGLFISHFHKQAVFVTVANPTYADVFSYGMDQV